MSRNYHAKRLAREQGIPYTEALRRLADGGDLEAAPFIAVKRGTEPWAVGDEVEIYPVPPQEDIDG